MPSLALPPAEEPPAGGGSPTAAARAAALATLAPAPAGGGEAGAGIVAGEDRCLVWVGGVPWSTPAEEAEGVLRGALAGAGISEEAALVQVALFGPHRRAPPPGHHARAPRARASADGTVLAGVSAGDERAPLQRAAVQASFEGEGGSEI